MERAKISKTQVKKIDAIQNKWFDLKHKAGNKLFSSYWRGKVTNTNFTIISNSCVAGWIYQKLGLQYSTPTIGLFFYSEDYIKFLENIQYYVKLPLKFTNRSKHPLANEASGARPYPIGVIGDDVEIQFVHYKTEAESAERWKRRTERIDFQNLFIIYSDRDGFKEDFLRRYEKLPFQHKIFLSSKPRKPSVNVIFIPGYESEGQVGMFLNREYEKYFDVIKWLNQ